MRNWTWLSILSASICAAPDGSCQTALYIVQGPEHSGLGYALSRAGDILAVGGAFGGDGVSDFVVACAPQATNGERALVISGVDGAAASGVLAPPGFEQGLQFGFALDGGQDVTGDGVPDIVVGAPRGAPGQPFSWIGSAFLFSGADLSLVRSHVGTPGSALGWSVAVVPDMDGDSVYDYALGAPFHVLPGALGKVYIHSGVSGALIRILTSPGPDNGFASSLVAVGDLTGDGIAEMAVGASSTSAGGLTKNGAVHLFNGSTGVLHDSLFGPSDFGLVGRSVVTMSDDDGDAWPDYAVNRWSISDFADGALVVSGANGRIINSVVSPLQNNGAFGFLPIDSTGDLDGDGRREILLAARSRSFGELVVMGSASDEAIYTFPQPGPSDGFGNDILTLGDVTGDGLEEWVIGDPYPGSLPGTGTGSAWIVSAKPLSAWPETLSAASGNRIDFAIHTSMVHGGAPYVVLMSAQLFGDALCSSSVQMHAGMVHIALCDDIVFKLSLPLVLSNSPPFEGTTDVLDGAGKGHAALDLTGVLLPPAAVGLQFRFQCIAKGDNGIASTRSGGGPWSFASNVAIVEIVP